MVKSRLVEYVPVLCCGVLASVKESWTLAGSELLQEPPPPVQALLPTLTTVRLTLVLTVWAEAQEVPKPGEPQVNVRSPLLSVGPPVGLNSELACTVSDALPVGVVRAL
jgi:hypothetical protein